VRYQGFGSFHSDNIEELIRKGETEYRPPERLPDSLTPFERHVREWLERGSRTPFGTEFLEQHYRITKQFVFINHGAFGGALYPAIQLKKDLEELAESQPLAFYDRLLLPWVAHSVRRLAQWLDADVESIALVQNATAGLNACVRSLIHSENDVVAYLDTEYLSVYKMCFLRCEEVRAGLFEIPVNDLFLKREVIGRPDVLAAYIVSRLPPRCTTVVIDMITSTSAMELPIFSHVIPALRRAGVGKIIVDGAHAPLQIDLKFRAIPCESQPDCFVGNLHKWFSAPKSCGFIWVKENRRDDIHPVVISHGAREGFLSEFVWDGTRDYGSYLLIPVIIDFWEQQGVERVRRRCRRLLNTAQHMLVSAFGVDVVPRHSPFMALVRLPEALQEVPSMPAVSPPLQPLSAPREASPPPPLMPIGEKSLQSSPPPPAMVFTAKFLQDTLHDLYRIEVPVKKINGVLYFRVSSFVYNTMSDYGYLRDATLDIVYRAVAAPHVALRKRTRGEEHHDPQFVVRNGVLDAMPPWETALTRSCCSGADEDLGPHDVARLNALLDTLPRTSVVMDGGPAVSSVPRTDADLPQPKKKPCGNRMKSEGGCGVGGLIMPRKSKRFS
jgi:hypothetical protein